MSKYGHERIPQANQMNWAGAMEWIMKPEGPAPKGLYAYVARRVKVKPATTLNRAKIRYPSGMKKAMRETLETGLDNLCRAVYKARDISDGTGRCYSCGCLRMANDLQWGHFISQGQSQYLRWDPRNFGAQCVPCNILQQGRQVDFGAELDRRHGPAFSEGLRQEAHRHKHWHPSIQDLEDKRIELKQLLSQLNSTPTKEEG